MIWNNSAAETKKDPEPEPEPEPVVKPEPVEEEDDPIKRNIARLRASGGACAFSSFKLKYK